MQVPQVVVPTEAQAEDVARQLAGVGREGQQHLELQRDDL